MMFFTPGIATLFAMPRPCGTSASIVTFTFVTPSSAPTISIACDSICSLTGQAGVVSTMRNETSPPSIFRSRIKPSVTISLRRSGSMICLRRFKNYFF